MQPFTISNTQYTNSQLYTITPGPGIGVVHKVRTQQGGEGGSLEKHMKAYGGGGGGGYFENVHTQNMGYFSSKNDFFTCFPQC